MVSGRNTIVAGLVLFSALVALGMTAKTSAVTRWGIAFDAEIATHRSGVLTVVAKAATHAASSAVAVALVILVPLLLWLLRRRRDAVLALLVLAGALAVAYVAKLAVGEQRPPSSLWVIAPDNAQSFPSGHTTVAAALTLALALVMRGRARVAIAVAGAVLTVVVAMARVYLGVHYPLDVIGGALAAACAALLACGLVWLPIARHRLDALESAAGSARHATPVSR